MSKRFTFLLAILLTSGMALSGVSYAATSGTATVTLAASAQAMIQVLDPAVTLTPTATDYNNNYVEITGASGLRVRVRSNSSTGLTLSLRCADAAPEIALADLLVRTQNSPGGGGVAMGAYTAITAADQTLWTSTVAEQAWQTVTTDIRVQNLINYPDAGSAGTTAYTNTLTYTVAVQ
jgi:hypothetical protein